MKIEIRVTDDESQTLYLEALDEHYHSTFGAIQESEHVFIRSGFDLCKKKGINVLEMGFGTGLNCYLTMINAQFSDTYVAFYAIEKYPLPENIWSQLHFRINSSDDTDNIFSLLHQSPWNCDVKIKSGFLLHKLEADILQLDFIDLPLFDLIYYDAFSPEKQPELWELSVFEKLYSKMNIGAILVTYCAKGYVRRNLQLAGLKVERITGPPGKREMLRAIKIENK